MTIVALMQARMGSSRFPGKILAPLLGKPMIQWQIERLKCSKYLSTVAVVTSEMPQDDELVHFCKSHSILCYRGSESNVLNRFYSAGNQILTPSEKPQAIVVRVTGDCPLFDPALLDEGIKAFLEAKQRGCRYFGFGSNLPDGLDFEIMDWSALVEAETQAIDVFDREHVTPYLWKRPEIFKVERFEKKGVTEGLRFSVDYSEDLKVVEAILIQQEKEGIFFGVHEIDRFLKENASVRQLNSQIVKNEGLIKSALASPANQVELQGRGVPKFGLYVPSGVAFSSQLLDWAIQMGVQVWSVEQSQQSADYIKEVAKNQAKLPVFLNNVHELSAPKTSVSSFSSWNLLKESAAWQTQIDQWIEQGAKNSGLVIEASTRDAFAEKLMYAFHSRHSQQ